MDGSIEKLLADVALSRRLVRFGLFGRTDSVLGLLVALGELAGALLESGRKDEAREPIQEILATVRELAPKERRRYAQSLAGCVEQVGELLREHYGPFESLTVQQEAIELRGPESELDRPTHLADLGMSLWLLAGDQRAIGLGQDAVATSERAVAVWDRARRAERAHAPGYGVSLAYLARDLGEVGRWDDAREAGEAAVSTLRRVGGGPDLAEALTHLSEALDACERPREAADAAEEAWTILRTA